MPAVIVGGVLEKDNKYLLVQEAKENAAANGTCLLDI